MSSRTRIQQAMEMAYRHLERACDVNGRFRYHAHLDPAVQLKPKYNIVRHAGAVYALADYAAYLDSAAAATVQRSAGYLLRTAVAAVPGRSHMTAVWSHPHVTDSVQVAQAKLGASGLALAALARYRRLFPALVPVAVDRNNFLNRLQLVRRPKVKLQRVTDQTVDRDW